MTLPWRWPWISRRAHEAVLEAIEAVVEDMTANGLATERPTAEDRDRWWRALMAIGYTREEGQ